MNDVSTADIRPAVGAFQKSAGPKMNTLLPHRIAVLDPRDKGASLPIIARKLSLKD
jgi:hypothetical protein